MVKTLLTARTKRSYNWLVLVDRTPPWEAYSPQMGELDHGEVVATYRKLYPSCSPSDIVFAPLKVVDDPRGDERRLFASVPYVQPGT